MRAAGFVAAALTVAMVATGQVAAHAGEDSSQLIQVLGDGGDVLDAARLAGITVIQGFPAADALIGTASAEDAARLDTLPGIDVLPVPDIEYTLTSTHGAIRSRPEQVGIVDADGSPYDGRGVTIAVIDSGVDGTHPMFIRPDGSSAVLRNLEAICPDELATSGAPCVVDVPTNDTAATSASGHGTAVASVAAGQHYVSADGRELVGVAPGAGVVALSTGSGPVGLSTAAALQWVLDNHADPCGDRSCPPIRVVNNSYTTQDYETYPDDIVARIQERLVAAGVVMVWGAGNDGGDGTVVQTNPWGQSPTAGVIQVAASDDQNLGRRDGPVWELSSRGLRGAPETYPDLVAPGHFVTAACPPQYAPTCSIDERAGDQQLGTSSGTSLAAPHVTGAVARLFHADPSLTPADVEDVLEDAAHQFGDPADLEADPANPGGGAATSFDRGHGQLDVTAAVERVLGLPAAPLPICGVDDHLAPDGTGDTAINGGVPVSDFGTLDLTGATVEVADDGSISAVLDYAALGEVPPELAEGHAGVLAFLLDDQQFTARFARPAEGVTTVFDVVTPDGQIHPTTGTYDTTAARVTVAVTAALLQEHGAAADDGDLVVATDVRSLLVEETPDPVVVTSALTVDRAWPICDYVVGGPNNPPVAVDDTATTQPGRTVTIDALANDTDHDGDALAVLATSPPGNGSASVDTDTLRYTPDPGFVGTDSFTYDVSDGSDVSQALVTVTVAAPSDPSGGGSGGRHPDGSGAGGGTSPGGTTQGGPATGDAGPPSAAPDPAPATSGPDTAGVVLDLANACPDGAPRERFEDVEGDGIHAEAIGCMVWWQILTGRTADRFEPDSPIRRDQLASVLDRLLGHVGSRPADAPDVFRDDEGSVHETAINRLAAAGIIRGRDEGTYAPRRHVSRAQLATLLVRTVEHVLGEPLPDGEVHFDDISTSVHRAAVRRAATAQLVLGDASGSFRPDERVRRAAAATMVARALERTILAGRVAPRG